MTAPSAKGLLLLALLAVAGCTVSGKQVETAVAVCEAHSGLKMIDPGLGIGGWTIAVCNDATHIEARTKK